MGKSTTLIGLSLFVSIVATLVMLGIQSVDPSSPILASNALAGSFNIVYPQLNTSVNGSWTSSNNNYAGHLPSRSATGTGNSQSLFPDWVNSGLVWINSVGSMFINVIGAPYTLAMLIAAGSSAGAVVGAGLALLNLFVIVGWILGKID